MAETHKGFGLLFEMGCGKTLTAIMIAGAAYQMGKVEKVLVVAPTSVCSVWPKDFAEFADFKANIKVLLGDKNRRLKLLNDLDNFPFKALKVAVINYESTWREGIFDALYEWNAEMIICDESQRIKSHDAEQSKAMHKLGDQAKYLSCPELRYRIMQSTCIASTASLTRQSSERTSISSETDMPSWADLTDTRSWDTKTSTS
mgnify:CR=1 FL=1